MEIHISLVVLFLTIIVAIGGWGFNYLLGEIKALAQCQKQCQENLYHRRETDGNDAAARADLLREKIANIEIWKASMDQLITQNKKDHDEMMNEIRILSAEVKELSDCVKLLSKGIKEC